MLKRLYRWILPIKLIKFDLWGTLGWKWYGGFSKIQSDYSFGLEAKKDETLVAKAN